MLGARLRVGLYRLNLNGLTLDVLDDLEFLEYLGGLGAGEEGGPRRRTGPIGHDCLPSLK